jgi:hypothetical protein
MGELGWVDILALGCFAVAMGTVIARAFQSGRGAEQPASRLWLVAGCAALAFGFGVLPAALCWEGLPHMGRSIGGWPAVALCTGAILSAVWARSPLVPALALILAVGQTIHFVPYYFHVYPRDSFETWGGPLRQAADRRDMATFAGRRAVGPLIDRSVVIGSPAWLACFRSSFRSTTKNRRSPSSWPRSARSWRR